MTDIPPTELTVLFADICRSTVLFDRLGDEAALNLVVKALELAGQTVTEQHGTIIGTIGDEIMCTFTNPEHALIAGRQIHKQIQQDSLMQSNQVTMRVGINSGTVVSLSNSVYGDTVNIAARLAQQAKANQSLVSANTIASIDDVLRDQIRYIGQINLRGKAGALDVHELLATNTEEAITEVASNKNLEGRSFLMTARYRTREMRFDPMLVRFLFGRGQDCDQTIDHPTISREHAEFLYRNGQFLLRDFSTNGSYVIQGESKEQIHRSSIELKGTGQVFLGRTLGQPEFCIEFTCTENR
ncbi:MAG: adenylate/guanylate cyclase domain-containing protein [Lysobacterales bacterium]